MKRRNGFTLVELLVVITILLVLSTLVWAVFRVNSSDKMRSAARIAQSAFLGAKDRALHAKDLRGVRLIRDTTNANFVTGFAYIQPIAMQSFTGVTLVADATTQTVRLYPTAAVGSQWTIQDSTQLSPAGLWSGPAQVRLPSDSLTGGKGGAWFPLHSKRQGASSSPPFWTASINGVYVTIESAWRFDVPTNQWILIGPANITTYATGATNFDLLVGFETLPFHQPISLPSGCIIDLANSGGGVPNLLGVEATSNSFVDLLFSPRGGLSGFAQGLPPLHFLLRDLKDATAGFNPFAVGAAGSAHQDLNTGDRLILSVFPQTGLVQIFEVDPTDVLTNGTAAGPPDGLADKPFNFAQQGRSAGR